MYIECMDTINNFLQTVNTLLNTNHLISVLVLVVFVVFGIVCLNDAFYSRLITWSNEMRGIQTKITKDTLKWGKFVGILLILLGIVFAVVMYFIDSIK